MSPKSFQTLWKATKSKSTVLMQLFTTTTLVHLSWWHSYPMSAEAALSHPPMICHSEDSDALLTFKARFGANVKILETWQAGSNCCWWYGVRCRKVDPDYARVNWLELDGGEANSSMMLARDPSTSPEEFGAPLGNLPALQQLILRRVYFNGPIPGAAWTRLVHLSHLELRYNNFTGDIPQALGDLKMLRTIAFNGLRVQVSPL